MRIAFFCPPMQGHQRPAQALAEALVERGHQCFLVGHPLTDIPEDGPLQPLWLDKASLNWTPQNLIRNTRSPGLPFGVLRVVSDMAKVTDSLCKFAPELLRQARIDGIVTDQMEAAGALIADHLRLPYVSIAAAFPINREPLIPLAMLPWPYEDSEKAIKRNQGGERVSDLLTARHDKTIVEWSARWGLSPRRKLVDCLSPLADVAQMVRGLDFPRQDLPATFHYVGPIREQPVSNGLNSIPDRDPRPLIYASLGSLQGHRIKLLQRIARACRMVGVRLVISHANSLTTRQAASIDADEVLAWAPQAEVLGRASAVITHAGLNTVLDALTAGLPMLCLPLAFEQPGISARVQHAGAGIMLSPKARVDQIAGTLRNLLLDPRYKNASAALGREIGPRGGARIAAAIVEQALSTAQPISHVDLVRSRAPI